jgi:nucleotide-binding universal stress UspA family protein
MPANLATHDEGKSLLQHQLMAITEEARLSSSPSVMICEGNPAREILSVAMKLDADLIVLGATGASKASRLLAAGVVHRVIAEAKAPVLTLRGEQEMSEAHVECSRACRCG